MRHEKGLRASVGWEGLGTLKMNPKSGVGRVWKG